MGLKPVTTRWFQMLCAANDVARAVEVLARTGHVQIESEAQGTDLRADELRARLPTFERLSKRYAAFWPRDHDRTEESAGSPGDVIDRGLARLQSWAAEADPVIERIQEIELELDRLAMVRELVEASEGALPDLEALARDHDLLSAQVLVLPPDAPEPELPRGTMLHRVDGPSHRLRLVVGPSAERERIAQAAEAVRARRVELPRWLPRSDDVALARIDEHLGEARARHGAAWAELEQLHEAHDIRVALRDIRRLDWYVTSVPPSRHTHNFAVVTGWTDAPAEALQQSLEKAGLCALVKVSEPPEGRSAPMVLNNPWWAKPFEVFAKLVGVPASGEVDPSALLSVIAPLLFGYMFGDLGQGFVLLVAGLILRRRLPELGLLVPGGIAAMVFGLLFGSVFAVEHVVPALWIHPMEEPLILLGAAVAGGAVILLIGLLLGGLSAVYRGRLGRWLATDGAIIVIYLGLLGMILDTRAGLVALAGVGWFFVGTATTASERRIVHALGELGELVERLLQLGVNTVSFARVGAFALAHAGLSAAIAGMMHGSGPVASAIILVLGNAVILVIEGLVVSIQTTRLVLFEFFARFLEAKGRAFIPLLPPTDEPSGTDGDDDEREPPSRTAPILRATRRSRS